ncbi:MAG: putative DNA binding domain-containing protein [Thermomicrobiales bacterium]|nr:putative DNA binding domain-containing protein [Thermomicrobiales bacterium]
MHFTEEKVGALITAALRNGRETPWFEFKKDITDPEQIAKTASAIANSAALHGMAYGAMIWGVEDTALSVIGTTFDPYNMRKGNESLIPWLNAQLENVRLLEFYTCNYNHEHVVVMIVGAATNVPTLYQGKAFARLDSHTIDISRNPNIQRQLWELLLLRNPDEELVVSNLYESDLDLLLVTDLLAEQLHIPKFDLVQGMKQLGIIVEDTSGQFSVPAWSALIYARDLTAIPSLSRKSLRFYTYAGEQRDQLERDLSSHSGYLKAYQQILDQLKTLLPTPERDFGAHRTGVERYSLLAINETIGNALAHQDLAISGAGPLVELFSNRIEITSPGLPLVDVGLLVNAPPQSRNEKLASHLRRLELIQERGSGWDIIAMEAARMNLPAPRVETNAGQFRVVFRPEESMHHLSREDRLWTLYLHACLKWLNHTPIANSDVRERFSISQGNAASASRLLNDAVAEMLLKPLDLSAGRGQMRYVPHWA